MQHEHTDDNDEIEDSTDVVSSSDDDDEYIEGTKILPIRLLKNNEDQGETSGANSIATANQTNVDRNINTKPKISVDGVMLKPSGFEPSTITPSKTVYMIRTTSVHPTDVEQTYIIIYDNII